MNYTKGEWEVDTLTGNIIAGERLIGSINPANECSRANAQLIAAAVNACIELNPDNPMVVAESISGLHEALKALSLVTRRVSYTQNELAHANEALAKAEGKE